MNPKVWLALAGAAILSLTFYLGKLQERSVNAPAIAKATKDTDALAGENKRLTQELTKSLTETSSLRIALQESERTRKAMVADTITSQRLLGLDSGGRPILVNENRTHVASHEDVQARRKAAIRSRATRRSTSSKKSALVANRQSNPWRAGGLDWFPEDVTTLDGLKNGRLDLELGVKFGQFTFKVQQEVLKIQEQRLVGPVFHPGTGIVYNW